MTLQQLNALKRKQEDELRKAEAEYTMDLLREQDLKRYGTFEMVTGEVVIASPMNIAGDWKLRGL